ncbi:MAG TPA: EamA family transporter [Roseiarcus sp.]|nr:EamA family transporter [Roseiarcus sp.]
MKPRDTLAAISVAIVWGLVFIAIKIGVGETTPLALSALRFVFAALPVVFFVRPPKASPWIVALYGLLIGVGQFGLLFVAIGQGFPVGLTSLVIQLQAFFTIFLAWALMHERPRPAQLIGAGVAFLGIALIGSRRLDGASLAPFLMVIAAALCWGAGNIAAKFAGRVDMLAFVTWSSLAPPAPLFLLSLLTEGRGGLASLAHPSLRLILAVLVVSYAGTVFGFGLWARLLSHYSAAAVAPFALLVPVVGMVAGWAVFHEPLGPFELWGALLVMAGLGFNVFGDRLLRRWLRPVG